MDNKHHWASRIEELRRSITLLPNGAPSRDDMKARRQIRSVFTEYYKLRDAFVLANPNLSSRNSVNALWAALGEEGKKLSRLGSWLRQGKRAYKKKKRVYDKQRAARPDIQARRKKTAAQRNKKTLDRVGYLRKKYALSVAEGARHHAFHQLAEALEAHWKAAHGARVRQNRRQKVDGAYRDYIGYLRARCRDTASQYELDVARGMLRATLDRCVQVCYPDHKKGQELGRGIMASLPTTVQKGKAQHLRPVEPAEGREGPEASPDLGTQAEPWERAPEGEQSRPNWRDDCGLEPEDGHDEDASYVDDGVAQKAQMRRAQ